MTYKFSEVKVQDKDNGISVVFEHAAGGKIAVNGSDFLLGRYEQSCGIDSRELLKATVKVIHSGYSLPERAM